MTGMRDLATDSFGIGVRIGSPADNIGGLSDAVEAPRFATVVGLAQYAAHRMALDGDRSPGGGHLHLSAPGVDKWIQRVREWLQDFF
jgi:cell division ATPase FtsA